MEGPQDSTEAMISAALGPRDTGIRAQMLENAQTRGNMPPTLDDKLLMFGSSPPNPLWVVDRLIEPQTPMHFFQACEAGELPGGAKSAYGALHEDAVTLLLSPPSTWAPAPYNAKPQPYIDDIMMRIGSNEDPGRLQAVSKELHFAKSLLWEGIVPLTDQAWRDEHKLDDPANFQQACQLIHEVIHVFKYFDLEPVRDALRDTYNLIHRHLVEFEEAFEAKYAAEPPDTVVELKSHSDNTDSNEDGGHVPPPGSRGPVMMGARWAEFMAAHFANMENTAHAWVTRHLDVLKVNVLHGIRTYTPPDIEARGGHYDDVQWALTNMWQDLLENQGQADWAICIPLEGYNGMVPGRTATGRPTTLAAARQMHEEGNGEGAVQDPIPLVIEVSGDERMKQYFYKRRDLQMQKHCQQSMADLLAGRPKLANNDPEFIWRGCKIQDDAQREMRVLFRGAGPGPGASEGEAEGKQREQWVVEALDILDARFEVVVYRTHHGHSDDEWNAFVRKFEDDTNNWGEGVVDADKLKARMKLTWRNIGGELKLDDTDAIREHFRENNSKEIRDIDFFLLADEASIESYLHPATTTTTVSGETASGPRLLPGDVGGFILAADVDYDPNEDPSPQSDEWPEWAGDVRLRGSMLWGHVMPQYIMQSGCIQLMFPMARLHPRKMYTGPVVKSQLKAWGVEGLGL